jgi:hypothetical protein
LKGPQLREEVHVTDDKTKDQTKEETSAQEDVELAEEEAENVKGGGGGHWSGTAKPLKP